MTRRFGVVLMVALGLGCAKPRSASICPSAYRADPERRTRIESLLARDPEAGPLLREADGRFVTCFGSGAAGVTSGSLVLLDRDADDSHLAARVAHLLLHRSAGVSRSSGDPSAPDEADGVALERRVLARLERAR